jgi:DNA-binding NarL/FixJ family response regulator
VGATPDRLRRARLLPACVEILLASGEVREAWQACRELEATARSHPSAALEALAAQARGALELAEGDAEAAVASFRRAFDRWQSLETPYLAARVRELTGLACRALGDREGGELELGAAGKVYRRLGAAPDAARVAALIDESRHQPAHHLTPRELQVLRLVADGKTNRAIAADLGVSIRTVDRHVSNILTKLDLPTRAAATAWAYRHRAL